MFHVPTHLLMDQGGPIHAERFQQTVLLTIDSPPVNALNQSLRAALLSALAQAEATPGVKALVLAGAGRAFIAGADIKEFGTPPRAPYLPDVCAALENSPLLVVAALHGACLGGGLEVALCADYRIAAPSARLGFPEMHLGLIPGAGGTQRLPRLIGVEAASRLITTGRHLTAVEAQDLGIVDEIALTDLRVAALDYAQSLLERQAPTRPVSAFPVPNGVDWEKLHSEVVETARGRLAPSSAVRALQASVELSFDEGMKEERRLFNELMQSDQRQAMIHIFFAERAAMASKGVEGVVPPEVAHLGVVGGGTTGSGIATAALSSGLHVTLIESSAAASETARDRIAQNLEGAVKRGKFTSAGSENALAHRLILSTDFAALAEADVVIEAVYEDMAVKKAVFATLDAVCKRGAVLATNTSYLDVNALADVTDRPADVLGLHFFSPTHVMKLLEVVVPDRATPNVIATGFALAKRLGKMPVRSGASDGFIGNRILTAYRSAADHLVLMGATPEQVDSALVTFGFAMGPYEAADLSGLDIGFANRKRLAARPGARAPVATFPDRLSEAGHLGRKSGRGYYLYPEQGARGVQNPKVTELIATERDQRSIDPRAFSADQVVSRYLAAMVNEAARVIDEKVALCPRDVDLVLIAGYGFPRHRGGPCKWADLKGLSAVLTDIETYALEEPQLWEPAPLLQQLVEEGRSFDDLNAGI